MLNVSDQWEVFTQCQHSQSSNVSRLFICYLATLICWDENVSGMYRDHLETAAHLQHTWTSVQAQVSPLHGQWPHGHTHDCPAHIKTNPFVKIFTLIMSRNN